jgi:hypothetical protein
MMKTKVLWDGHLGYWCCHGGSHELDWPEKLDLQRLAFKKPRAWKIELGTWNLEPGTWSLEPGTWNLELRYRRNVNLETWNLESRSLPARNRNIRSVHICTEPRGQVIEDIGIWHLETQSLGIWVLGSWVL